MNIGKNIMICRKKENLSQEMLAELVGVTRQTISNWELGVSSPDVNQLKKLVDIFKVNFNDIVDDVNIDSNNYELTIVSNLENVICKVNSVVSSSEFKTGKNSPKYALFGVVDNSKIFQNNIFLGWYEDKESISREIKSISDSINRKEYVYELKYNVGVDKKFFGLSMKIRR